MGIQGLHSFLKHDNDKFSAIVPTHLSKFRGQKAAIDAYSWLHKSVFSCAQDIFFKKPTTRYIDYCVKYIKLLLDHHVTPILVFDGCSMPFKVVNERRREDRQSAKKDADDLIAVGRMNDAYNKMVQSIDITHEMATKLMQAARLLGVESVVAPYEADAQLVYLEKKGIVDFIISEDSDLIIFGAKRVLFKLSPTGQGEIFDSTKMEICLQANRRLRGSFAFDKLFYSAVLSGCDYLKSLPGVGLMKAWKFMNMTANTNAREFLRKVPSYLKLKISIDDDYIENFILATLAFKYQSVFDTRQKRQVPLNELDDDESRQDYEVYLSRFRPIQADPYQLALGNVDPKENQYDQYHPPVNSYLYYGLAVAETDQAKASSSVSGFSLEGIYKRSRKSEIACTKTVQNVEIANDNADADVDLINYYKNLDITAGNVYNDEKNVQVEEEPPRKRIKCKFLKNKLPHDDDFEPVQSCFFKPKVAQDKTDDTDTQTNDNKPIDSINTDTDTASNDTVQRVDASSVSRISLDGILKRSRKSEISCKKTVHDNDTQSRFFKPKDETDDKDTQTDANKPINTDTDTAINDTVQTVDKNDNNAPKETKMTSKCVAVSPEMKKILDDVGIEVESDYDDDGTDDSQPTQLFCETVISDSEDSDVILLTTPDKATKQSPVIGKKDENKSRLKEIQNVPKFSRVKKNILKQPTLLSFFKKL